MLSWHWVFIVTGGIGIIWSLGNETGEGCNFAATYKWVHTNDRSQRPVHSEDGIKGPYTDIFRLYTGYQKETLSKRPVPAPQQGGLTWFYLSVLEGL